MGRKLWIAACFATAALAVSASAQEPKPGEYYEDKTDLGFKVRVPQKWESVPPASDDGNLIVKYDPKTNKSIQLGKDQRMDLHIWLLKFDRRKLPEADAGASRARVTRHKFLADWLKVNGLEGFNEIESAKDFQVNKIAATETVYSNKTLANSEVRLYAMLYKLQPDLDVVFAGWGPGDPKPWKKFEDSFREMARSFKTTEVAAAKPGLAAGASLRDKKRAEIVDALTRAPGWKLYETPNYFLVSANDDKAFLDELKVRLEAIRTVYEVDYPAAKAREIREAAARAKTGDTRQPQGAAEEEKPDDASKEGAAKVQPRPELLPEAEALELARCSLVRVCKNEDQYHSYGGPPQAAGHFDPNTQELVVYDDRAVGGKGDTWITLNHEAFHQYIFNFYGMISPHSWYNEGTGDFYSGYVLKNGRYTLEKNPWRKETIKEAIQKDRFVPLADFLRFSQPEYYNAGANKFNADGRQNYAQGWSLIYFLRTGKKNNAKGWNPRWDTLLEDYMRVLAATGKPEQAIEQCLTGIDVAELETAWIEYTR